MSFKSSFILIALTMGGLLAAGMGLLQLDSLTDAMHHNNGAAVPVGQAPG